MDVKRELRDTTGEQMIRNWKKRGLGPNGHHVGDRSDGDRSDGERVSHRGTRKYQMPEHRRFGPIIDMRRAKDQMSGEENEAEAWAAMWDCRNGDWFETERISVTSQFGGSELVLGTCKGDSARYGVGLRANVFYKRVRMEASIRRCRFQFRERSVAIQYGCELLRKVVEKEKDEVTDRGRYDHEGALSGLFGPQAQTIERGIIKVVGRSQQMNVFE